MFEYTELQLVDCLDLIPEEHIYYLKDEIEVFSTLKCVDPADWVLNTYQSGWFVGEV